MRYLRNLWLLDAWEKKFGIRVLNSPMGIMAHQEKVYAYIDESSLPSFVGSELHLFMSFVDRMKSEGHESIIVKPLDLFQGIGVEKWLIDNSLKENGQSA